MIPKMIHYCWFGGSSKPELERMCMTTWETLCPDFEIVEWNDMSFDFASAPRYVQEALEKGKWAFASDYARLKILYEYGGVYFDTDVELLKPLDDLLEKNAAFAGFDFDGHNINTGLGFGAEKGEPYIKEVMDFYDELFFERHDGSLFLLANTFICTPIFMAHGLVQDNSLQHVGNFTVYPKEYFCPKAFSYDRSLQRLELYPETRSIHHYALSWLSGDDERAYCESSERGWVDIVNNLKGMRMVSNY